jgi:hypothetical protein
LGDGAKMFVEKEQREKTHDGEALEEDWGEFGIFFSFNCRKN